MQDENGAEAAASASEDLCPPPLPDGEYAIVEVLGHRTLIGRVDEVERFGVRMLSVEPVFRDALLPPLLIGGASLYAFTPCTVAIAAARQPLRIWDLPASLRATIPAAALPAPDDQDDDEDPPEFAPAFLTDRGDDR